ncbi:hypothetical protein [Staphylococcus phage LY01]|nr:hypothetical protein [Staphylococcus phage LY01]
MIEEIFKLNFISLILNIPYFLISIYLFYYFYTYTKIKNNKDDIYDVAPVAFTSYLSIITIIILKLATNSLSEYGNLVYHPFKILTLIIVSLIIYVILDASLFIFDRMKSSLKIFILLNIFLIALLISDSLLFNMIIMLIISILLILTSLFFAVDYLNSKDKYMKITFSTFFTLFPLFLSLLVINMDVIKFNSFNNKIDSMYLIIVVQIFLLLWNLTVMMFKIFNINIYTVIVEIFKRKK